MGGEVGVEGLAEPDVHALRVPSLGSARTAQSTWRWSRASCRNGMAGAVQVRACCPSPLPFSSSSSETSGSQTRRRPGLGVWVVVRMSGLVRRARSWAWAFGEALGALRTGPGAGGGRRGSPPRPIRGGVQDGGVEVVAALALPAAGGTPAGDGGAERGHRLVHEGPQELHDVAGGGGWLVVGEGVDASAAA